MVVLVASVPVSVPAELVPSPQSIVVVRPARVAPGAATDATAPLNAKSLRIMSGAATGSYFGDQPSSAVVGRRGKAWNSMFWMVRSVSDQIGASTPMMLASVTAGNVTPPDVRAGM